ncbi:MAG: FAD-dependent oxidoreductase [Pseudomonadota bacterium]
MSESEASRATDPYQRQEQIFPVLSDSQVERIKEFGECERLAKRSVVFRRGDRTVDFFVLLDGNIEIFDGAGAQQEDVFTVHGRHQFTGELDLFNDRKILVSGRMGEDGEVLRLNRDAFRRMMTSLPDIAEIIMRAFILRRVGLMEHEQGAVVAIGHKSSSRLLEAERFMRRNGYPVRILTLEDDAEAEALLSGLGMKDDDLPIIIGRDEEFISRPSLLDLAHFLGIAVEINDEEIYDTIVVGAGPAGLAAAVYAASEGLKTLVLEGMAPGGQAGTSSKIENYLGFPTGISGQALAGRAQVQAQKFGAVLAVPFSAKRLCCQQKPYRIFLENGDKVCAKSVVVASGARYRGMSVDNLEKYEGQNVHYAATAIEARLCGESEVIVIGGGNSAGQAAVFLSQHADHVHMLVRGPELAASMSDYLVGRIHASPKITLYQNTELCEIDGDEALRRVAWKNRTTGEITRRDIAHIFVMIGAAPNTDWLDGCLALDDKGFILTGKAAEACGECDRSPYAFESSVRGIFAVGDVRADSVKRVASGVGEGSVCIADVHKVLTELYSGEGSD